MGRSKIRLLWLITLALGQIASAQRSLPQSELVSLIQQLTGNHRKTWLSHGSLKAVHTRHHAAAILDEEEIMAMIRQKSVDYENNPDKAQIPAFLQAKFLEAVPFNVRYDYQNDSTTITTEHIKVRGKKFYRETCIDSHTDSVTPTRVQAENHLINRWSLETNKRRVYSYDGKRDTKYIKSANFALVEDSLDVPERPNALRAGLIPWGTGMFSPEAILRSAPSASTQWMDGRELIHLEFHHELASVAATLDPEKSLATLDCTITKDNGEMVSNFYLSDYTHVGDQWIPAHILVEEHIAENGQHRLLKSDQWQFELLESSRLEAKEFTPKYQDDALINYVSPLAPKPLQYRYRRDVDTDKLLSQRLFTLGDNRPQNCASVAIEYIAQKLGKSLTVPPSILIDYAGTSTLYDMQQYLNNQGLFAKAIETTTDALSSYEDCFTIVYLPNINHYLLIEHVDEQKVWALDLTSDNFYMSYPRDSFQKEWRDGIALLVSDHHIATSERAISSFKSKTISGGDGLQCTEMVQAYSQVLCPQTESGLCYGYREIYFPYKTCAAAPFGECQNNLLVLDRVRNYCKGSAMIPEICNLEAEMYFFLDWACWGYLPPS